MAAAALSKPYRHEFPRFHQSAYVRLDFSPSIKGACTRHPLKHHRSRRIRRFSSTVQSRFVSMICVVLTTPTLCERPAVLMGLRHFHMLLVGRQRDRYAGCVFGQCFLSLIISYLQGLDLGMTPSRPGFHIHLCVYDYLLFSYLSTHIDPAHLTLPVFFYGRRLIDANSGCFSMILYMRGQVCHLQ